MTDIKEIIAQIDQLTPVPPIAIQIMVLAEDPDSSLTQVAELILNDPAITANLIKTCNSAYFGLNRKVDSVQDAIAYVGLDHIVQLVLLHSVSQNFIKEPAGSDWVKANSGGMPSHQRRLPKYWPANSAFLKTNISSIPRP